MTQKKLYNDLASVFKRLHENNHDTRAAKQLETLALEVGKYSAKNNQDDALSEAHKQLINAYAEIHQAQEDKQACSAGLRKVVTALDLLKENA